MSSCVDWTLGHCDLLSPQRSVKAAWVSLPSCILPVWSSAGSPSDTPPPAPSAPELLLPPDTVWKSEPTQTSHHVYSTGYSGNISGSFLDQLPSASCVIITPCWPERCITNDSRWVQFIMLCTGSTRSTYRTLIIQSIHHDLMLMEQHSSCLQEIHSIWCCVPTGNELLDITSNFKMKHTIWNWHRMKWKEAVAQLKYLEMSYICSWNHRQIIDSVTLNGEMRRWDFV